MSEWVRFTANYDHVWPSRAQTAFKAGMICFVKDEVAKRAFAKKKAEPTEKPEDGDPNHVTTAAPLESVTERAYPASDAAQATIPDDGGHERLAERDDVDDVGPALRVRVHVPTTER